MINHKRALLFLLLLSGLAFGGSLWAMHSLAEAPTEAPAQPAGPPKPFTIVALPDTQFYSESFPQIFASQTDWIVKHRVDHNIIFVTHEGDIVNTWDDTAQWERASQSMATLDPVMNYGIAPGNHDQAPGGDALNFEKYFPMHRIAKVAKPAVPGLAVKTGSFGSFDNRNNYRLFEAAGRRFIAINLDFCPTDATVEWTGGLLKRFANRQAIITTHSFINANGQRETVDQTCKVNNAKGDNSATEMWQKLVINGKHNNILLVLSGHDILSKTGAARRTDIVNGRPIYQLMADYQQFPNGGNGYLRLLKFDYATKTLGIKTYSPWLDAYVTDPQNQFELKLP